MKKKITHESELVASLKSASFIFFFESYEGFELTFSLCLVSGMRSDILRCV